MPSSDTKQPSRSANQWAKYFKLGHHPICRSISALRIRNRPPSVRFAPPIRPSNIANMPTAQPLSASDRRTYIRWHVCAFLLFSTTIVYLNRTTLGVLKPTLKSHLHFGEAEYGWLQFAFQTAYALMFVFAGRFVDWAGARIGLALGVIFWSLATAAGGLCHS